MEMMRLKVQLLDLRRAIYINVETGCSAQRAMSSQWWNTRSESRRLGVPGSKERAICFCWLRLHERSSRYMLCHPNGGISPRTGVIIPFGVKGTADITKFRAIRSNKIVNMWQLRSKHSYQLPCKMLGLQLPRVVDYSDSRGGLPR
jgi:hypothetical protein